MKELFLFPTLDLRLQASLPWRRHGHPRAWQLCSQPVRRLSIHTSAPRSYGAQRPAENEKSSFSRQRIIAALMKRMALGDPLDCEPAAFNRTIFLYRFQRVFAACRRKPAARRLQRGNIGTIEPDGSDQECFHDLSPMIPALRHNARIAFSASA